MGDRVDQVSRMLEKSNFLIFVVLSFAFGQKEATFGCCPLKEVQGAGDLAGVYYLVDTDQPFPDACKGRLHISEGRKRRQEVLFCTKHKIRFNVPGYRRRLRLWSL